LRKRRVSQSPVRRDTNRFKPFDEYWCRCDRWALVEAAQLLGITWCSWRSKSQRYVPTQEPTEVSETCINLAWWNASLVRGSLNLLTGDSGKRVPIWCFPIQVQRRNNSAEVRLLTCKHRKRKSARGRRGVFEGEIPQELLGVLIRPILRERLYCGVLSASVHEDFLGGGYRWLSRQ